MKMQINLIKGVIYSKFDEKLGPVAIVWEPKDLTKESRDIVSLKTISLLLGEEGQTPKTMSMITLPSINSKGLVKMFNYKDETSRGKAVDCSLTLLFDEINDTVFYKYFKNFEQLCENTSRTLKNLEEKKSPIQKIHGEIQHFYTQLQELLQELCDQECGEEDLEEFPEVPIEEVQQTRYRFKLIVCGDPGVGKTSIILRFTDKAFRKSYISTVGVNITEKIVKYDEDTYVHFTIWDLAGQSKFNTMRRHFYKGADASLLVFDLTRQETFNNVTNWYQDVVKLTKRRTRVYPIPTIILGNKADLKEYNKVQGNEIENLIKNLNIPFFETSALTGKNVDDVFYKMAGILIDIYKEY